MLSPRRFLPSLSLLAAFEAVARGGSVTAAARELALTQSAVSRQIRTLEDQLEVTLFHRERQTLRLTPGGAAYAREIRDALARISAASLSLRANPSGGALTLAAPPTFATRWLTPRLPRFLAAHPGVTVHLLSRPAPVEAAADTADAAIVFGAPDGAAGEAARLRGETVVPACSPALRDQSAFRVAADVRRAPLLHLRGRPDAWEQWLERHGAPAQGVHGMLIDDIATLAQAAISGLGVALLPEFLIGEELRTGALVRALDLPMVSVGAYYLVWPRPRADHPPLVAFRDWILAETAAEP